LNSPCGVCTLKIQENIVLGNMEFIAICHSNFLPGKNKNPGKNEWTSSHRNLISWKEVDCFFPRKKYFPERK
jgi:hypothetical protein